MVSFQLPPPNERNCLHVFAASYIPSETTGGDVSLESKVKVSNVHSTRRWDTVDGQRGQVIEVTINNPFSPTLHPDSSSWASHPFSISLHGSDIKTLRTGKLARLMPGDKMTVEVLVIPSGTNPSFANAEIRLSSEGHTWSAEAIAIEGSDVVTDWTKWTEAVDDLEQHSTPSWFSDAKFGVSRLRSLINMSLGIDVPFQIFIHWGLFSVPAWTDENKYAEWYNWWLHNEGTEGGSEYSPHLRGAFTKLSFQRTNITWRHTAPTLSMTTSSPCSPEPTLMPKNGSTCSRALAPSTLSSRPSTTMDSLSSTLAAVAIGIASNSVRSETLSRS